MITDRDTIDRLADLHHREGVPPGDAVNAAVALLHAMPGDGRRAVLAAMSSDDPEHRRLVAVHATRGVVHAWHDLLGQADWRAFFDSRTTR